MAAAVALLTTPAAGQRPVGAVSATAVAGVTRVDPSPEQVPRTDGWLEQPALMGRAAVGALRVYGTLNLEGLTMPDGVPTPGAFGEGFFDRRHPHTYVHELVLSYVAPLGRRAALSVSAGKGFVAFGTDDPMNRPPLRFPINHHFSQLLERAVVTLGVRVAHAAIEGSLFNGDEPERPGQWPSWRRFGDSWAVRLSARPAASVEAQASWARVKSPEHRPGAGPTQNKLNASVRGAVEFGPHRVRALAEFARTTDAGGFFTYYSALAELELRTGRHRPYYRFERTDRPEEERQLDPFRSVRPHLDDSILGITRWTVHTAGYGVVFRATDDWRIEPLIEVTVARPSAVGGGLFDAEAFYGTRTVWSFTAGVRLRLGAAHRMGRYGVLDSYAN